MYVYRSWWKIDDNSLFRRNFSDLIADSESTQKIWLFEYLLGKVSKMYARVPTENVYIPFFAKIEKSKITQDSCRIIPIWLHFWNLHKIWSLWTCLKCVSSKNIVSNRGKYAILGIHIYSTKSAKSAFAPLVCSATSILEAETLFSGTSCYGNFVFEVSLKYRCFRRS